MDHEEKAWDAPLLGFANGADPIWRRYKEVVGPFHWTPGEAFQQAFPMEPSPPEALTIISWVLPQTEATKIDQRARTVYPAERWARSRIFGERFNRRLRRHVADQLTEAGTPAVAPDGDAPVGDAGFGRLCLRLHVVGAPRGVRRRPGHLRALRRADHAQGQSDAHRLGRGPARDPGLAAPVHRPPRLLPLLRQRHLRGLHPPLSGRRALGGGAR